MGVANLLFQPGGLDCTVPAGRNESRRSSSALDREHIASTVDLLASSESREEQRDSF